MAVNGFREHLAISLRLHFRNRMALLYGYLFPTIFLGAFWALYRHEQIPLLRHMGELLTVSVLGGACFGLPTAMVSERERGVWRRYRLTPAGTGAVMMSTVVARYLLVLSAGGLQLALALAVGMTMPADPAGLFVVFTAVAFAFIGLGLVIAMLADSVPAVQALGQCVFLPMLIVGGVAVPLAMLPEWAQHVSAFFPGRYAVEALQACVTGGGLGATRFDLLALGIIGAAGCLAGAKLFRWESGQRLGVMAAKGWLGAALGAWIAVGLLAEWRGQATIASPAENVAEAPAVPPAEPWELITEAEIAGLDYANVPPDNGLVTPMAPPEETPSEDTDMRLATFEGEFPHWPPGHAKDPVQRTLNLLCVAGLTDLVQHPIERYVPALVLQRLEESMPREQLVRMLTWIVLHPEHGEVVTDLSALGIQGGGSPARVRERAQWYAMKFVAKLTGRTIG